MAREKLTRTAVVEHAIQLADAEGMEAVTIRRLAHELGVTAMALYWHFKNKDELLLGIVDHAMSQVKSTHDPSEPWLRQLRSMVDALIAVMRAHPCLPNLLHEVDKDSAGAFARAVNDSLDLLRRGGLAPREGYWVASYLLHGAMSLVGDQPCCPAGLSEVQAAEWRRQKRLGLEKLPADQYPMVVAFARTLEEEPDVERYFAFGIDLLMAGVEGMTTRHS